MEKEVGKNNKKLIGIIIASVIIIVIGIILLLTKGCANDKIYTVTFNSDGGSIINDLKVKDQETITRPNNPDKEGYIFLGWYYKDELFDFNSKITSDLTLEARWEKVDNEDEYIKVTGISINKKTLTLEINEEATLLITIKPNNATVKDVTWSSSDPKIVSIDENGKIKALKEGKVTITVETKDGNYEALCTVTVKKPFVPVQSVSLTGTKEVYENETIQLSAKVLPENATNKKVTYKSSNNQIATVDNTGKVKGLKEGQVTITVTTDDGNKVATINIVVKRKQTTSKVDVQSVSLTGPTEMYENETIQLSAKVLPENATNKKVTYKSSNNQIATVDNTGKVKGLKEGQVTITVTTDDGHKESSLQINIKKKDSTVHVSEVQINGSNHISLFVKEQLTLSVTVLPANATNKKVTFSSKNNAVATVNESGIITAIQPGTTEITITSEDNHKEAIVTVEVKAHNYAVTLTGLKQELQPILQYEVTEVRMDNAPIAFTKLKFANGREAIKKVPADWVNGESLATVIVVLTNGEEVQATITYTSRNV